MPELTTSQIDRLGERLRASRTIEESDLNLLQRFRGRHVKALAEVQVRIERAVPGVEQTARIKTIQTLHDKIRRQPTKLSRVQDIAGVRIVQEMDLDEQDAMVRRLAREFPGAKVVDRRERPSYGYRAVHVVARVYDCWCEIQVRTRGQHIWAEVVERLSDHWGRQIRYGGAPDDPTKAFAGGMTRAEFWLLIRGMADNIYAMEELATRSRLGVESTQLPSGVSVEDLERQRHKTIELMGQLRDLAEEAVEL